MITGLTEALEAGAITKQVPGVAFSRAGGGGGWRRWVCMAWCAWMQPCVKKPGEAGQRCLCFTETLEVGATTKQLRRWL